MCRGIRLIEQSLEQPNIHVRCLAHIVNLAVKAALSKIHNVVESLRKMVSAVRLFVKFRDRFESLKSALNLSKVLLPGLDVETRWSSKYFMLSKAIKARPILTALCSEIDELQNYSISNTEWITTSKLCKLLHEIYNITSNQSARHSVSLSMTPRVFEILRDAVDDFCEIEFENLVEIANVM